MSPSSLLERASVTFLVRNVCTCGSCKVRTPANKMATTATAVRHIILYTLSIAVKVYNGPICKNSKNIGENL
jgi:cytochrome b561